MRQGNAILPLETVVTLVPDSAVVPSTNTIMARITFIFDSLIRIDDDASCNVDIRSCNQLIDDIFYTIRNLLILFKL